MQEHHTNTDTFAVWVMRLLLTLLYFFGAEILLWTNPLQHSLLEWGVRLCGYVTLATLTLDLAARYRIREVYDGLVLCGIYGLCVGLLLQPETSLVDFPRTLMTRVMGGHTLIGAEMFGLFLVLTDATNKRYSRLLLGFALWLGFYWGVWVRWSPTLLGLSGSSTDLVTMFSAAGVVFAMVLLALVVGKNRCQSLTTPGLRQSPSGMGLTLIVLIGLFLVRLAQGVVNLAAVPAVIILIVLCYSILWFRRADRGKTLLDAHIPPRIPGWGWIVGSILIFSISAVISYNIPLTTVLGFNQLSVMEFAFAAGGLLWLPLVAAMLSVRAIDRQAQKLEG